MNIDPAIAAGYVVVAIGGFAIGAFTGRWMLTEMRTALGAMRAALKPEAAVRVAIDIAPLNML